MSPFSRSFSSLRTLLRSRRNVGASCVLSGLLLTSASCTTPPRSNAARIGSAPPMVAAPPSRMAPAAPRAPIGADEGVVRAARPSNGTIARAQSSDAIEPVAYEVEPRVQPTGFHGPAPVPTGSYCPPIEHNAECRVPLSHGGEYCPPGAAMAACPKGCPPHSYLAPPDYMPSVNDLADEYICDGGDQGNPIFYNVDIRDGIDAEDTFATYVTQNGVAKTKISNVVCIYAPRFAAVRSIASVTARDQYDKLGGVTEDMRVAGYEADMRLGERVQRDMLQDIRVRNRAGGLIDWQAEGIYAKVIKAENHVKLVNVFEDMAFLQDGVIRRTEAATISRLALAAGEWSVDQTPVVVAEDIGGQQVKAVFKAEEYVGVEEQYSGCLRICKMADKQEALPGDVVTFTLRIDNIEKGTLQNVVVTDSLTPRLELLPESLQSDLAGEFSVQPNKEGSSIINFTLKDPMKGQTGGVITFQARVR